MSKPRGAPSASSTPEPEPPADNPVAGIAWVLLAMLWFVALDTLAKYLMQSFPVIQVVWGRFLFHVLILSVLLGRGLPQRIRSRTPRIQLWRSCLMLATTTLFFAGLKLLPLATAATLMFLSPIFVTVMAMPLLGERVGWRRWLGVAVGFAGALVVVRPGLIELQWSTGFVVAAALSHALYQIMTRRVRAYDGPLTSLFYTGLVGAAVATVVVPAYWHPVAPAEWLLFAGLGAAGCVGHLCFIRGFQRAPASVAAPFGYTTLVWAALFGLLLFGEVPDRWTLAGAALIIGAGLYIFHRERAAQEAESG